MHDGRLYENLRIFFPDVRFCKRWGQIPEIKPAENFCVESWLPFSAAASRKIDRSTGIHMFLHDFQFERLWNTPNKYIPMLQKAGAVCSPDFSMYTDTPRALNLYNHYRKHWLAAFWQSKGITVIPTICWTDDQSFEWCFDGEPKKSVVAVSSIGVMKDAKARERFIAGYQEMVRVLKPKEILFMGTVPKECTGKITVMERFTDTITKARSETNTDHN